MSNSKWSLPVLMQGLHARVEHDLKVARDALGHPVAKGDGSEAVWIQLFRNYLPKRYAIDKATICDSRGEFSDEIDVAIYDRQYAPLIFEHQGQFVIPAESVYAVFESKQEITGPFVEYAQAKVRTVRALHRTSTEVRTIDGLRTAELQPILGGFLAFENGWKTNPPDEFLSPFLQKDQELGRLDIGCVAAYGTFGCYGANCISTAPHERAVTCFLLDFITKLQRIGTAPAIDMSAYAEWLGRDAEEK
jgi:hypothetical protein